MSLRGFAIFFLAIVQYSLCYGQMDASKDPILEYLDLDANSAPEYEMVQIELFDRLHKRAFSGKTMPTGTRIRFRVFGVNVNLWLHPRDSILATIDTPVYSVTYYPGNPGNVRIGKTYNVMKGLGELLEDPKHLASVVIGTDNYGRMTVNGRIGSQRLVIRSLPDSVVKEYARKRRSIDDLDEDFLKSKHHVVYRINDDLEEKSLLGVLNQTILRERVARSTSGIPYIIYPKILVVVDHSIYKQQQGRDINRSLEYLLAFWNSVDLMYRELGNPRVRLHIAGIFLGEERDATPYISNHMLSANAFLADTVINNSARFFYRIKDSIPLAMYDVAFTMTRFNFGLGRDAFVTGKAFQSSACENSTSAELMLASTIIRDNGGFNGVSAAAHELGHVLGMKHDETQSNDCMYRNGFIMARVAILTKNSSSFSKCSIMDLQQRLDEGGLECMYNAPNKHSRRLPTLMPGRIVSREKQCSLNGLGLPCNYNNVIDCVNLYCRESDGHCKKVNEATVEGTRCNGEDETSERFCIHSQCVRV